MKLIQRWHFFILLCLGVMSLASADEPTKVVYILPGMWGDVFAANNPVFNRDNCLDPICSLRDEAAKKGIDIRQADVNMPLGDFDYIIFFDLPDHYLSQLSKYPKEKMILFLWEPPSVIPKNYEKEYHQNFSKVYTWNDTLVDNKKYFKLHYAVMHPMIKDVVPFEKKKFSTLISCNKQSKHPQELYSERRKVISFYEREHPRDFDLYGKWWPKEITTYRGPVDKKVDILKQYKFAYAYENIKGIRGYVTEKIFDCFQAGCVPIYLGASNIAQYVPKGCFIARSSFDTEEKLYQYLKNMEKEEYEQYIQNIQRFLVSKQAQKFSIDHFVSEVIALISPQNKPQIAERTEDQKDI